MQSHSMSNSISHATNNAIKTELVVIIKIIPYTFSLRYPVE